VTGFEWAENNLGAETPHQLQARGVDVYFAPNIAPDTKVVNLADGRVEQFVDGEARPRDGYYANFDSLVRYCRARGIPLNEVEGQASVLPVGRDEAGDPLRRGEAREA